MAAAKSALLVGATGLIGRELLRLLAAPGSGYGEVHALVRRPWADAPAKVHAHVVDFDHMPSALPTVDDVFCALGTTIKVAGSQEAFRRVDHDHVLAVARSALAAGATQFLVVSALGADAASGVFYNRVKGEMERDVAALGYRSVTIAQPSLLAGDRASLNQAARPGEQISLALLKPLRKLIPLSVRPIEAATVARALVRSAQRGAAGVQRLDSKALQQLGA
jgi:uncharacterized protein YbjT (DUF2867 family)